jgi:hypothetical protein
VTTAVSIHGAGETKIILDVNVIKESTLTAEDSRYEITKPYFDSSL